MVCEGTNSIGGYCNSDTVDGIRFPLNDVEKEIVIAYALYQPRSKRSEMEVWQSQTVGRGGWN